MYLIDLKDIGSKWESKLSVRGDKRRNVGWLCIIATGAHLALPLGFCTFYYIISLVSFPVWGPETTGFYLAQPQHTAFPGMLYFEGYLQGPLQLPIVSFFPLAVWLLGVIYLWKEDSFALWYFERQESIERSRMTPEEQREWEFQKLLTMLRVIEKTSTGVPVSIHRLASLANQSPDETRQIIRQLLKTYPVGNYLEVEDVFVRSAEELPTTPEIGACQVCGETFSTQEPSHQCSSCFRYVCWQCSSVGIKNCPFCKASLVVMPFYCNQCTAMIFNVQNHLDHTTGSVKN